MIVKNKFENTAHSLRVPLVVCNRPVPTDSNIWVAIQIATQISATIFIFMCGDRKVAIISAILIAIRAPLIVRLFENNRDYLKIIATIFCAKCVRTVNENRTGFLYPIMQGGRSVLPVCVRCVFD